jgi:hypothetical protein
MFTSGASHSSPLTEPASSPEAPGALQGTGAAVLWFVRSAGILLLLTGTAKIYSALYGEEKMLISEDPIAGIQLGRLMLWVGGAEVVVALLCWFRRATNLSLRLLAAMSTTFLFYRFLLWYTLSPRPCPCMGNLTDPLGLSLETADMMMKALLAYLVIGSYSAIVWLALQRRRGAARD